MMIKLKFGLAILFIVLFSIKSSLANVIDFEDFYNSSIPEQRLTDGYNGFNWSQNIWVINAKDFYHDVNWKKGTLGNVSIFGGYEFGSYPIGLSKFSFGLFNFESAYLTSAFANFYGHGENLSVLVEGWRNGMLEYTQRIILTDTATQFLFGFDQIDTLWFKPDLPSQIIIDNLSFQTLLNAPEPSSSMLFGFGILVFLYVGRRNKAQLVTN